MDAQEIKRAQLLQLLGKMPPRDYKISVLESSAEEYPDYRREKLLLDLNGIEPVPAYLLFPKEMDGPVPAMLYHHAHGLKYNIGKEEIISGRSTLQNPPYGEALTRMGMAVLCFDTWAFGGRSGKTESYIFKKMLWLGQTMLGMMIYDSFRAIDYLVSRPEIDPLRIGTMGLSMGSTMSWWTAALDTRIRTVVDLCCMTDFHTLLEEEGLDRQGLFYYVPDLLNHFTTAGINSLIAPRPHLCLAGIRDELTPPKGLDIIDQELSREYARLHAPDAWRLIRYDVGHEETAEMRRDALSFLKKWL